MNNLWRLTMAALLASFSQMTCAQTRTMGLTELFDLADAHSLCIQLGHTEEAAASEALTSAKQAMLPDIHAAASVSYIGNGYLTDRNFKNGSQVTMPHFGNNFSLAAEQVIYAGGAIKSGIRLAQLESQRAALDVKRNQQEVRFALVGNYLDLFCLMNQRKVLLGNLELTKRVLTTMEARRRQGTVLHNDITRYELQREQLELQLTRVNDAYSIKNHYLVTTLHLPATTIICPDTTLVQQALDPISAADWQALAAQRHADLQAGALAVNMGQERVRLERSERLPKVALVAEGRLDGPILIEVPTINSNFGYWYAGVGIKYNLSALYKNKHRLQQARIVTQQAEEQLALKREQVDQAVQAGYVNYLTAQAELRTQLKRRQLADENYGVVENRYRNDLALLTDMLDASNTKLAAEMDWVNAQIGVIYRYFHLRYTAHAL